MTQRLAERSDLYRLGIRDVVLSSISPYDQDVALDAVSAQVQAELATRYSAPWASWGDDIRKIVCQIAAYDMLSALRGYNPAAGADPNIRDRAVDARKTLISIAKSEIGSTIVTADSTSPVYDSPKVVGLPAQGWQRGAVR